jgi:hypothetical protein
MNRRSATTGHAIVDKIAEEAQLKPLWIAIFAGVLMTLAFGISTASAATVSAKQASLNEHQDACLDAGGTLTSWHFIINQIRSGPAPGSISVTWSNGDVQNVPLTSTSGPVAHYNVTSTETHTLIQSATANIYDGWSGQFNLSSVECRPPSDACTAFGDRIVIRFDALLGNPADGLNLMSEPVPVNIPAGTYTVTLQSFDDHVTHPGQNQQVERWYAVFDTSGADVPTNAIGDLPEEPTTTLNQQVGTITLATGATSVTAVHYLAGSTFTSPESVYAVCLALDPVNND